MTIADTTIICEKCGVITTGPEHLDYHLRKAHRLPTLKAARLAEEMHAHYRNADERIRRAAPDLLDACDEAHQLLWHYELVMQENGVDWGRVEELRQKMLDRLSAVIAKAREG